MKALTDGVLTESMAKNIVEGSQRIITLAFNYSAGVITREEMEASAMLVMQETCDEIVHEYDTTP